MSVYDGRGERENGVFVNEHHGGEEIERGQGVLDKTSFLL